jgi:hypothetical protein
LKSGEIVIKGSANPHRGYVLASAKVEYNVNGCDVKEATLPLKMNRSFEKTITGLTPGAVYCMKVIVVEGRPGEERTLALVAPLKAPR